MTKEKKTYQQVGSRDIFQIYELLLNKGFISFPLTYSGKDKIESIVSNINSTYYGQENYPLVEDKAVAYIYFLIKDHPFTDGNKRTACLVFEIFCNINSIEPNFKEFTLDELAVFIEKLKQEDYQKIIKDISHFLFS